MAVAKGDLQPHQVCPSHWDLPARWLSSPARHRVRSTCGGWEVRAERGCTLGVPSGQMRPFLAYSLPDVPFSPPALIIHL